MGKLDEKYRSAEKALQTLDEVLKETYTPIIRDASIQRFEYTFEICWKTLQAYLKQEEGIIANSPKTVFREALAADIFDAEEVEKALQMTDDRNLTTHTYHEEVAQQIFKKLPDYYQLMNRLLDELKRKM